MSVLSAEEKAGHPCRWRRIVPEANCSMNVPGRHTAMPDAQTWFYAAGSCTKRILQFGDSLEQC